MDKLTVNFTQGLGSHLPSIFRPLVKEVSRFTPRDRHFEAQALAYARYELEVDELHNVRVLNCYFGGFPFEYKESTTELYLVGDRWILRAGQEVTSKEARGLIAGTLVAKGVHPQGARVEIISAEVAQAILEDPGPLPLVLEVAVSDEKARRLYTNKLYPSRNVKMDISETQALALRDAGIERFVYRNEKLFRARLPYFEEVPTPEEAVKIILEYKKGI